MTQAAVAPEQATEEPFPPPARRGRKGLIWLLVGVLVLAASGIAYALYTGEAAGQSADEPTASGPVATAEVSRGDLAATETWGGTLGYGTPFTVSAGEGTITRLSKQGGEVERGTVLFRIDEQPVVALYGKVPMYRDLASGDSGVDVLQLEQNLTALGYDGFDVDEDYTWYTDQAVRDWQEDIGAAETGTVMRSAVVFLTGAGRIDNLHLEIGDQAAGSSVLDITGEQQVVTFEVEVDDKELVEVGTKVGVTLPGGEEVAGTVSASSVVATETDTESNPAAAENAAASAADSTTQVEVTLAENVDAQLVGAPVDVIVDVDQRTDVLRVPVNALLALAEGGYGLEVVAADGSASIVAVETGLFADGLVEVSGDGIDAGTVVGVAGR